MSYGHGPATAQPVARLINELARLPGIDLTSVRQDIPKMARLAVKAAVERLERPTRRPKDVVLRPKLVVRGTTAVPRTGSS